MAEAHEPPVVKLICGMISSQVRLFNEATRLLTESLGPVDLLSEVMAFDFTHYYDRQMGSPLHRRFLALADLVPADALVEVKHKTNAIEADLARRSRSGPRRPINLDPGYVESGKLVLASMKNYAHRIYVGRGVYAEVTLVAHRGRWVASPWTFPDFASPRYHPFLTEVRQRLREQVRGEVRA